MSEGSADEPFRAEYAKSGRSSCKACKMPIEKAELRLAVMVQSPMFDGKVPNWHHVRCFFQRNRPKADTDIGHLDALRWEDQEKLRKLIADSLVGLGPSGNAKGGKKSKSSAGGGMSELGTIMGDFRVEMANSGGAGCRVCEVKIKKGLPRIGKKDYESQRAKMYGPYDRWHHVKCFAEKREELEFFDAGENLAGFKTLSKDHQQLVKDELKPLKGKRKSGTNGTSGDEPDAKRQRPSSSSQDEGDNPETKEKLKKQMKKIYYYRDMLDRNLKKKELQELMTHNDQEIPSGTDKLLDRLSDCMLFGALKPCKECGGQFTFRSGVGYQCLGNVSEWTKCQEKTTEPARKEFKLPDHFRESYDFCKLYKFKSGQVRIVQSNPSAAKPSPQVTASNGSSSQKSGSGGKPALPLKNLTFVLEGDIDKAALKADIEKLGGSVGSRVSKTTAAVISNIDAVEQMTKTIASAKRHNVQVVSDDLLQDITKEGVVSHIKTKTISKWGSEPRERIGKLIDKAAGGNKNGQGSSMFSADLPKSMKLKLKGGAYVDPESGLEHKAHVYKSSKDDLYSVVLGSVDIQEGRNSYYKLQLLQHDKKSKYYIFRSWGRVGTTIGGTKLEDFRDKQAAIDLFQSLYQEKTGNSWRKRKNFEKVAGKFFPMDLDMGQDRDDKGFSKLDVAKSTSKLPIAVQQLVALIFDVETMKKAMVEFEIDLTKMPLGKLSKKQIESAYKILTEVLEMIKTESGTETKYLDASNRFFTLIPHDFGLKSPPILQEADYIKSKIEMLDNLLEIEIAYKLLQESDENANSKDPIDAHYEKLKTDITVLDRESDEFQLLEKYVKNTHAATHTMYTLEVEEIFKIARKGEATRFKPHEKLGNRMLLWHGSRVTNYAGILSQGLRIAPPEAPTTGYMFGKGIYFADMVSKSANYCQTNKTNNTGLLLLCDVALGQMYERTQADYIERLPKGMHSTKGLGKTEPDPKEVTKIEDGKLSVPCGSGVASSTQDTALLYNEYIIYDVAQCKAKYLFRMKFNYKY